MLVSLSIGAPCLRTLERYGTASFALTLLHTSDRSVVRKPGRNKDAYQFPLDTGSLCL
jgi:hypothetical protein